MKIKDTKELINILETIKFCDIDEIKKIEAIDLSIRIIKDWDNYLNFVGKKNAIEDAVDYIIENIDYNHLKELVQSDKEGKCLTLPCSIGSSVWAISFCTESNGGYYCPFDCNSAQRDAVFSKRCIDYCRIYEDKFTLDMLNKIGKTIFLSKKEAMENLKNKAKDINL